MVRFIKTIDSVKLHTIAETLKMLAHPIRLDIIELLDRYGIMNVSELLNEMDVEQSLLSHHLVRMRERDLLFAIRRGKYVYYELNKERINRILDCINKCEL